VAGAPADPIDPVDHETATAQPTKAASASVEESSSAIAAGTESGGPKATAIAADPAADEVGGAGTSSIRPPNTAPTATATVAAPDGVTGVTRVTVTASDIDDDGLTYAASRPTWGRVNNLGNGDFAYSTNDFVRFLARFIPFIKSDSFSVTVNDGQGGTTTVKVNTTVVPLNSAPVVRSRSIGAPNATTGIVVGNVKAADPNWDSLSYIESVTATDKGTVSINRGGGFTYTPNASARHAAAAASATAADKTDSFNVQVVDKYGALVEIPVTVAIGPVNAAPTGSATVSSPDALTGITMGTVIGLDADSDTLSYSGSTTTLKGAFAVNADGSFAYTPTSYAQYNAWHPYATASDLIDAVGVTVEDGHGGSITVPVRVEISPSDKAPPPLPDSTFCGCTLMPADTIFHADVRSLSLLRESDEFIELLGGARGETLRSGMGAKEWMGSTGGGMPVNVVEASHPKETVIFNRGYSTSGPGIDDRPYAIPDRPLVEGMPSAPAWDRHLFVFQKETCISQELINVANGVELPDAGVLDALGNAAYRAIWGDQWIAGAGAQYDMSSRLYPEVGHANASRLPFLPMMLRPDDLERGEIDHMLGFSIAADRGAGFTWPARAGDGTSPEGIPMGTVFRLSSDFDITPYSRGAQIILRGLQVRGAVVYDSFGAGREGAGLLAMSTGWTGTEHITAAAELNTIPMQYFEAVDVSSIAVDPSIGWQIR
jgi:VCBS repeat-containing protein